MNLILMVAHVLVCVVLIGLVLIQQGKGADSAFGGGASSTVFGSQGSTSFIVKTTALIAFLFFISTASLTYYTQNNAKKHHEIHKIINQDDALTKLKKHSKK